MDDLFASIGALWTWYWRDAKARQRLLKAERVEVDDQGTIDVGQSGLSEEAARLRGWGKVMRSAYNPVMGLMERRLDNIVSRRELQAWWNDEALSPPGDQGEEQEKLRRSMKRNCSRPADTSSMSGAPVITGYSPTGNRRWMYATTSRTRCCLSTRRSMVSIPGK